MNRTTQIAIVVGIVIVVVVVVLAAGFMGSNNNGPPATGNNVNITTAGGYSSSFAFSPGSLTVHLGDNVTWTNNAGTDHTVTSDNSTDPFSSGTIHAGGTYTHQFNLIGTFSYHCSIHTYMTGKITVIV
jgi:plastocyanin